MKSLTLKEIKELKPCWLETAEGREKFKRIGSRKERWTALDILELSEDEVSAEDKLWVVLRKEFLSDRTLHIFACDVAESALNKIENPDPRSLEAIRIKRLWIDGKATDEELDEAMEEARAAAWDAATDAATDAARDEARDAAWDAARDEARAAARDAAWDAARDEARAAARNAATAAARDAVRNEQINILINIIKKEENNADFDVSE